MIKKLPNNLFDEPFETIWCDHCGEGMQRSNDNNADTKEFVFLHYECTKPKNNNLGFLAKAEPLV